MKPRPWHPSERYTKTPITKKQQAKRPLQKKQKRKPKSATSPKPKPVAKPAPKPKPKPVAKTAPKPKPAPKPVVETGPSMLDGKKFSFEFNLGGAYSFESQLDINVEGHEDILLHTASYENRPFEGAPYYGWRLGLWGEDGKAWELELIHHKLYLSNPPEGVESLEITHGYNLLTVNRAWPKDQFILRAGAGVVLAHPEVVAFGELLEEKHFMGTEFIYAGPTIQLSAGQRFKLTRTMIANVEGKLTASYADIEMENANIVAPNFAAHLVFGVGFDYTFGR